MGDSSSNNGGRFYGGGMQQYRVSPGPRATDMQGALNNSLAAYLHNSLNGGFQGVMGIPEAWTYGQGGHHNGGGNQQNPAPPPATDEAQRFAWTFPQYSQSWAFTPPTPTPYMYPQPFDTDKYGNPLNKKNIKKNV